MRRRGRTLGVSSHFTISLINLQLEPFFHSEYIKAEVPYHIHHKHHVEQVAEVKYIKVPVEKEVKILEPYKVPYKVKVPYIIKQEIHTVPVHKQAVHSSEHVFHKPTKHAHGDSKSFSAHGASSNIAPMVVSHTPVRPSSHDAMAAYMSALQSAPKDMEMFSSKDSYPAYSFNSNARLHTSVQPSGMGFGSQEGKLLGGYEVKEPQELVHGPVLFGRNSKSFEAFPQESSKSGMAYDYPFPSQQSAEFSFGFGPSDYTGYDFSSFH